MAQPWRPPVWALLVAGLSWRCRQVLPPSVEELSTTGSGMELVPRKATLHRYTLPKNGLEDALSAQMSSLSDNSAAFCLLAITGSIQALWSPAAAACTLSVRETTAAEKPAKPGAVLSGNARLA